MTDSVNIKRVRSLSGGKKKSGPVVYWMSRDQRVHDNWALLYAQETALKSKAPLIVLFNLVPQFLEATLRQYDFMLTGLAETESEFIRHKIPFKLLLGNPSDEIPRFLKSISASALVTDFSPLKINRQWKNEITNRLDVPFYEVDAHNIVPCWIASPKLEFGAYTIRPKIHKLLPEFLEEFPKLKKHPVAYENKISPADWLEARKSLKINREVKPVDWLKPGETAGHKALGIFLTERLKDYDDARNDPAIDGQSDLSPYFHFGHIAPQRAALEVKKHSPRSKSSEAYLEESVVRRELSDNFCFYNPNYDNFKGFPAWAQQTLNEHRKDKRDYCYSLEEFEDGASHDSIWNAAQKQMTATGKMHGYMRMYWAKKILEWTKTPEDALAIAIHLNDKYELDGRDPNGYTGVAWSIGGVHDRAWFERPVYGKIRYMNDNGLKRKFDVSAYIQKTQAQQGTLAL